MRRSSLIGAVALLVALPDLAACSAEEAASGVADASGSPSASPSAAADDTPGIVPTEVAGYDAAAQALGADRVDAAVRNAAAVAHIALADCHRWTTGEVDPRLTALVTPELLAEAVEELDRSGRYGGTVVPSLLSHLPTDDGNGNDQTTLVREGCDDSAPLRFPHGAMHVRVAHGGDAPRLQVDCACVTTVTFGTTRIGAAQDWVLTMEQGTDGWRLADVDGVVAHVNWHPAPPA